MKRLRSNGVEQWDLFVINLVLQFMGQDAFTVLARVCRSFRKHVKFTNFPHIVFKNYRGGNKAQVFQMECFRTVHSFANLRALTINGRSSGVSKCPKLTHIRFNTTELCRFGPGSDNLISLVERARIDTVLLPTLVFTHLSKLEECDVQSWGLNATDVFQHPTLKSVKCKRLNYDLVGDGSKSSSLTSLLCGCFSSLLGEEEVHQLWSCMATPINFQYFACRLRYLDESMLATPNLVVAVSNEYVPPPGAVVEYIDNRWVLTKGFMSDLELAN